MDPLTWTLRELTGKIADLPETAASLILRALLFFGVTTGLTGWAFRRGSRSIFIQSIAFTIGILIATFFPIAWLVSLRPTLRVWVLMPSLVALLFLPARLPFYLTPNAVLQRRIGVASYLLLFGMLIISSL